ncbi:MAG: lactoylglutathione lyase [Acholeplasmataceae bacterium]|nr:VOC family protein [Acidaminococcaceae bacterium]NLY83668.1 lactoylglutathione lyase [Acholeplasmataceae bacterium]
MNFKIVHNNINVLDLEKSLKFYEEALGLKESRRKEAADGSFILVYLGDGQSGHLLELTWLRDRLQPYNLGDNEFHLAFETDDFEAAHAKHLKMDCICYENPAMGIYFINDPDNYWLEIVPAKK